MVSKSKKSAALPVGRGSLRSFAAVVPQVERGEGLIVGPLIQEVRKRTTCTVYITL